MIFLCLGILSFCVPTIYNYFFRPVREMRSMGEWAVITGATDGIGRAYAFKMASLKMNVVLLSRTKDKLEDVAREIQNKYPNIKTQIAICDYSDFNENARNTLWNKIQNLDIGVLINNVGISYEYPKYFHELTTNEVARLMEMNVGSTTWMTHMILPGMMERKRGSIVNIASAAGCHTMPLLSQYSAAKGYIVMFSRGLNAECRSSGVSISCQTPFYIATKLAKLRSSFMVPTPEAYVEKGVRWIGYDNSVVSPFWIHAIQGWMIEHLPASIVENQILKMHDAIRKRGNQKKTR